MKRIINITFAAVLIAATLSSCGTQSVNKVSMYDLCKAMSENAGFGDMTYVSSSDKNAAESFEYISELDYQKVDTFFADFAADGAKSADEIAVITLKDKADADEALRSLQSHLEYRKSLYKTYGPDQLPKLEKALTFSNGIYAVIIVADNPNAVKTAFENFIK